LLVTKYFGGQIEEKEMGGACGTCGERTKMHTEFLDGKPKERDHLKIYA
jgi:hypothetical protein